MASVCVVFHSGYGHTQRLAQAVAQGADAELLQIDAAGDLPLAGWDTLAAADAIVFGSPTYMGSVSWQFKRFADASSKVWYEQGWKDKLAAGFTTSGGPDGDKMHALHTLYVLAMQHSMLWISQGLMPSNKKSSRRDDPNWHASYAGALGFTPIDVSAGEMSPGDLATGRLFGERIAAVAARWMQGAS